MKHFVLTFLCLQSLALAQDAEPPDWFKKLDRNGDGGITRDEMPKLLGRQCLMARRLLEAGVRFVEVCHGGWDQHRNLREDHATHATAADKPIAGLLADLAARGLLADTVVLWAGEFGRTPDAQGGGGRDMRLTEVKGNVVKGILA